MNVVVKIPQKSIDSCLQMGWDEDEIKDLFQQYLYELVNQGYDQFQINFETWLQDLDEEEDLQDLENN